MTWFRVDDKLAGHPKARAAGLKPMGLWVVGGAHSSAYLLDGFVEAEFVRDLRAIREAERLVDVGLWHPTEGGWEFHEWAQSNPTRAEVEADREAARKRMREMRARRA